MATYSLNSSEKLKSRKSIERLFRTGITMSSPPFRLIYQVCDRNASPAYMTVAVPRRMMKRATDRNLIKRRCREAYRKKKPELYNFLIEKELSIELLFLYQSTDILDYRKIQSSVNFLLIRLMKELS